jgi:dipeptidyl aminopeptidase/acylaminoacyl peptidase
MSRSIRSVALALFLGLASPLVVAGQGVAKGEDQAVLALVQAPGLFDPVLSEDGLWVAYLRRTTSLEENGYRYAAVVRRTDGSGAEQILVQGKVITSPFGGGFLAWSPVGGELAFSVPGGDGISLYAPATQARRKLALPAGARRLFTVGTSGFKWAPDGRKIAFTAPDPETVDPVGTPDPNAGAELDEYWDPVRAAGTPDALRSFPHQPALLWVMDLRDGKTKRLTSQTLDVMAYSWAPDGRRLVVSAGSDFRWTRSGLGADLHVVDSTDGSSRPLPTQRGGGMDPAWSPDGKWIAFTSQKPFTTDAAPRNLRHSRSLYRIKADGSEAAVDLLAVARQHQLLPVHVHNLEWSPDSRDLYFEGGSEMRSGTYRVRLDDAVVSPDTPREVLAQYVSCTRNRQGAVACVRQTPTKAPEIVVRDAPASDWRVIERWSGDRIFDGLSSEIVEWRSADDKWDVHGILIKPPGFDPKRTYPLMVYIEGGPQMVRAEFGVASQYPLLAWAQRGYLVLAPNTRGRPGYGPAFDAAIADERSQHIGPHGDIVSGVDALVKQGIVDPKRMGITGFSYGFGLGLETIAQTKRFRAASLGDGVAEMLSVAYSQAASPWYQDLLRDLAGIEPMTTPAGVEGLLRESSLMRIGNVATPVLAEFGSIHGLAATQGRILMHALRLQGVPVELIAYPRTGHGVVEPLLRIDSMRRNLEWFDYWVEGKGTPRMTERYGAKQ